MIECDKFNFISMLLLQVIHIDTKWSNRWKISQVLVSDLLLSLNFLIVSVFTLLKFFTYSTCCCSSLFYFFYLLFFFILFLQFQISKNIFCVNYIYFPMWLLFCFSLVVFVWKENVIKNSFPDMHKRFLVIAVEWRFTAIKTTK